MLDTPLHEIVNIEKRTVFRKDLEKHQQQNSDGKYFFGVNIIRYKENAKQ